MTKPVIRITVDGRPAITAGLAHLRYRLSSEAATRMAIRERGVRPVAWLDGRRPLYDVEALDDAMATRRRQPVIVDESDG